MQMRVSSLGAVRCFGGIKVSVFDVLYVREWAAIPFVIFLCYAMLFVPWQSVRDIRVRVQTGAIGVLRATLSTVFLCAWLTVFGGLFITGLLDILSVNIFSFASDQLAARDDRPMFSTPGYVDATLNRYGTFSQAAAERAARELVVAEAFFTANPEFRKEVEANPLLSVLPSQSWEGYYAYMNQHQFEDAAALDGRMSLEQIRLWHGRIIFEEATPSIVSADFAMSLPVVREFLVFDAGESQSLSKLPTLTAFDIHENEANAFMGWYRFALVLVTWLFLAPLIWFVLRSLWALVRVTAAGTQARGMAHP